MEARTGTARLCVLGAAFLFSTGGAAIKGTTLSGFQVACLRSAVAAVALGLFMPRVWRGLRMRLIPAALAYAATLILFVTATKATTAGAAIFLQSTAPFWILMLSRPLLGERISRREWPFVGLAGVGLLLVFLGSRDVAATAPQPALGNALALGSGLTYALMMLALRSLAKTPDETGTSLSAMLLGNTLAVLVCLPYSLPFETVTLADGVAVSYLGVVQIGLAYLLFTRGLQALPPLEVALLALLEPVLNPLWTWLAHDERPSLLAMIGGSVLLAALASRTIAIKRRHFATAPAGSLEAQRSTRDAGRGMPVALSRGGRDVRLDREDDCGGGEAR